SRGSTSHDANGGLAATREDAGTQGERANGGDRAMGIVDENRDHSIRAVRDRDVQEAITVEIPGRYAADIHSAGRELDGRKKACTAAVFHHGEVIVCVIRNDEVRFAVPIEVGARDEMRTTIGRVINGTAKVACPVTEKDRDGLNVVL